jgi:hypothetical protein
MPADPRTPTPPSAVDPTATIHEPFQETPADTAAAPPNASAVPGPSATYDSASVPEPTGPDGWTNWRAQRAGVLSSGAVEYAGYTDAQLLEEQADLGPCRLLNTIGFAGPQAGQVPLSLVLRVEWHATTDPRERSWEQTDTATWHGGRLDDELAALVSLALGIRLQSGGSIRLFGPDGDPRGRPVHFDLAPPYLPPPRRAPLLPTTTGPVQLGTAAERLAGYPELTADQAGALVKAARAWQEAVWVADADPRQAWLRLVSALEAAAQAWAGGPARSPEERLLLARPKLAKRLTRDATAQLHRIVAKDLDGIFKATEKFIGFTMAHLPDPPAARPPEAFRLDWGRMAEHLALVYEWRSRDLHDGTPIPLPMCQPPLHLEGHRALAEVRPVQATWTGGATWNARDIPMPLHTFAYITRGTLLNWLATTTITTTTTTTTSGTTGSA